MAEVLQCSPRTDNKRKDEETPPAPRRSNGCSTPISSPNSQNPNPNLHGSVPPPADEIQKAQEIAAHLFDNGEANLPCIDNGTDEEDPDQESSPAQNGKKPPRQWTAWTRHEEEIFFNALRQVGKNFEKITSCVQSKNKNQVRHYYYRLIKRMNKLLGPGFSLDAKNTKDANSAMLRWWSLLEKHSCTASKLHLKPRLFKTFVTALERQLKKDRKKIKRKQPSQDEHGLLTPPTMVPVPSKTTASDTRSTKMQTVDRENIQKIGPGKGDSLKRNVPAGVNCSKGDSSTIKAARQRRRTTGSVSSAAHKEWEKAASVGVYLVAEAAEQLERTTNGKCLPDQGIASDLPREPSPSNGLRDTGLAGKICHHLPPRTSRTSYPHQLQIKGIRSLQTETEEPSRQTAQSIQPSVKLKLQVFPIDEETRKGLEKEGHNPHLELILRGRKKISSVLEHLNRKWGSSSIVSGELMLLPYGIQQEDFASSMRWTVRDTVSTAADVYATIGSPAIFRLRYGWFSKQESNSGTPRIPYIPPNYDVLQFKEAQKGHTTTKVADENKELFVSTSHEDRQKCINDSPNEITERPRLFDTTVSPEMKLDGTSDPSKKVMDSFKNQGAANEKIALPSCFTQKTDHLIGISAGSRKDCSDGVIQKQWEDADELKTSNGAILSAGEWADSLTTVSVSDLLSEASQAAADAKCFSSTAMESTACPYQIPFSCDSFDAAIAAHLLTTPDIAIHSLASQIPQPSIWDAEVTCDAFAFQKKALTQDLPSSARTTFGACSENVCPGFPSFIEELKEVGLTEDPVCHEEFKVNPQICDDTGLRNNGITDIYWPDSLGPLDLAISSFKCQTQDMITGDSVSLSGLIASSLDAFQNCSFFSSNRKG